MIIKWKNRSAVCLAGLLLSLPAQAAGSGKPGAPEDNPGATVQELLAWLEQRNPELKAMQYETEAAEARVYPAGALDDPMFRVEWEDIPRDNPTLLPGGVGSVKYTVAQAFPLWGKRGLKREIAEAEVVQARGRRQAVAAELRAKLKTAFVQHYQALHTAHLTQEIMDLTGELERLARTRYANGLGPQQDVIKAQAERTTLRTELITLEAEQRQTRARLNAVLGRKSTAPLAEPRELPALPKPAKLEGLEEHAKNVNAEVFTQSAQITAAERNQRLTLKNRYPDLNVAVSAVQREERIDGWEVMLEVNIPLQQETRRSQEREAAAMLAAAQTRYEATVLQVQGELQEALAGLDAARQQAQVLKTTLQPQAELTFRSALASYQTGAVDFATLLDGLRQMRQANLDTLKAEVEQRIRLAEIERLVGEDL